jgi:hypothetical protein
MRVRVMTDLLKGMRVGCRRGWDEQELDRVESDMRFAGPQVPRVSV